MLSFIKSKLKKIISSEYLFSLNGNDKVVFLFHDVSTPSEPQYSPEYSTEIRSFKNQIELIKKKFELISLDKLLSDDSGNLKQQPLAAITFDDGFYSVFKHAFPYLNKEKIPFSIFVNRRAVLENTLWFTALVLNKNNPAFLKDFYVRMLDKKKITYEQFRTLYLHEIISGIGSNNLTALYNYAARSDEKIFCDISDLKTMLDSRLVSVHFHSSNHFILKNCPDELLVTEIDENKEFVKSITGKKDNHFAIPFGKKNHFDERELRQLKKSGYQFAYTTNPNTFEKRSYGQGINLIPRISLTNQSPEELMFMINMSKLRKRAL